MTFTSIPELTFIASQVREKYVDYDRLTFIKEELDILRYRDNKASEGGVMAIVGEPGSGKTKLIMDYMSGVPVQRKAIQTTDGWADRCEVLDFNIKDASAKNVLEIMYSKMTGIAPGDLRRFDLGTKVPQFAKEMQVQLMIFDEAHQAIDDKTDKVAKDLARLFKDLSNEGAFSVALAGTPEDVERLVLANDELERRVLGYHELLPLRWDQLTERAVFIEILNLYDEYFAEVFGKLSGLAAPDTALRIHIASFGVVGLAAKLIERAAIQAGREQIARKRDSALLIPQATCITWKHLEEAFTYRKKNDGRPNAFLIPPGAVVSHDPALPQPASPDFPRKLPRGQSEALFVKR